MTFLQQKQIVIEDVSNIMWVSDCVPPCENVLGTGDMMYIFYYKTLNTFPVVFHIIPIGLRIFYSNFVYFFSKGLKVSFCNFCTSDEVQLSY